MVKPDLMKAKSKWLFIFLLVPLLMALTQSPYYKPQTVVPDKINPPYLQIKDNWARQVLDTMTLDEKIGQLFIYQVYPGSDQSVNQVRQYIKQYHLGGVIFFRGSASQIAKLSRQFQSLSPNIPLFLSIDAEWGVNMRIPGTVKFPYEMTLGAISNNNLIAEMGHEIARQLHLLGLNMNFAPVVDVNINPRNPVIGVRSFGQDPVNVAAKGFAYTSGLQDSTIIAFAKHFPGHGDTDKDSHKTLPVINHHFTRLWQVELYPYRQLIPAGLGGIMIAHLYIPAIEDAPNTPTTLSRNVITKLLRDSLHFNGLVITDAMNMQGVMKYYGTGEAEIRALLAGNDILLMPQDLPKAYNAIKQAVISGEVPMEVIDSAVIKILRAKQWLKTKPQVAVETEKVIDHINSPQAKFLSLKLYENAITLVKDIDSQIPLRKIENKKIAVVSLGAQNNNVFQKYLQKYARVDAYSLPNNARYEEYQQLREHVKNYDIVIVSIHATNSFHPPLYGVSENAIWFVARLANETNVILDVFAPPYILNMFKNLSKVKTIIVSYENVPYAQQASAEIIFGGIPARGKLPVAAAGFKVGTGIHTKRIRLKYSSPIELGINPGDLKVVDSIIYAAIDSGAFPGCQVLAIKDTVVFFQKTYGYLTYSRSQPVRENTLYDIASLTKTTATTLALMKLYDQGKFDINQKLGYYLPELDTTDKADLRIIDILTHQARLKSWIPFYLHTYIKGTKQLDPRYFSSSKDTLHNLQVANNMYIINSIKDTIFKEIAQSKLRKRKRYLYSDLGFILFRDLIERQTGTAFDKYVETNFYRPLGAWHTLFNPLRYFPKTQIAPTEKDTYFRHQLVQGYVHDYAAAMLGGVSGHAGLFSTANDLGIIYQMLLQKGYYADRQYISPNTITLFTTKPFRRTNRRALGFDSTDGEEDNIYAPSASDKSYGHTGFTGCMVWVDPEYNFIFVFLSNRIYPDIKNPRINKLHVRRNVHEAFYQAIKKAETNQNLISK